MFGIALSALSARGEDDLEALLQREVVGPSRYAQSLLDAPASVAVLGQRESLALGHGTVAEMLARLPGVHLSHSRQYVEVGLRGFNRPGDYNSRLLVTIDGVRINDPVYDQALPEFEFPLVPEWVKRLELVYGPSSSVYGANALLGVVNLVTLDGADAPGLLLKGGVGSFGTRRLLMQYGHSDEQGGDLFIGLQSLTRRGESLVLPELGLNRSLRGLDGVAHHSVFVKAKRGEWRLAGTLTQRDKDVATAPYGSVPGEAGTRYRDRYGHVELGYEEGWSQALRRSLRLSASRYQFRGEYVFENEQINRDDAGSMSYSLDARLQWRGWLNHELLLGMDARLVPWASQRNADLSPPLSYLDSRESGRRLGVFAQDQWRLSPHWQLTSGVRIDRVRDQESQWSPRLALVWRPKAGEALKLMMGRAFRAPNFSERFYGDDYSQVANPGLGAERMRSLELGWERALDERTVLSLMVYSTRLSQAIELQQLEESGLLQYRNLGTITSQGVDLAISQLGGPGGVQWRVDGSYIRARHAGERVSNSPPWLFKGHAVWPLASAWSLGFEWQAQGKRQGKVPVPWQWTANGRLQYKQGSHEWGLRALNLGDRLLHDPAGPDNQALLRVPQPRRSLQVDWTWKL
ncbi:MAG: TonB-dependent receptor [Burkholderiales bacterium]|nr:TonB-dependent receptor [Burkholderiales bacterium]